MNHMMICENIFDIIISQDVNDEHKFCKDFFKPLSSVVLGKKSQVDACIHSTDKVIMDVFSNQSLHTLVEIRV